MTSSDEDVSMGFRTYRFAEPKVLSVSDMDDDATSDGVEVINGEPVTLTTSLTPLQPSVTSQKSSCAESVASKGPFKAVLRITEPKVLSVSDSEDFQRKE
eukprot:Platyproteum_vivax@DN7648_c2_g1_i25.p1